jgi:hypothetical protein
MDATGTPEWAAALDQIRQSVDDMLAAADRHEQAFFAGGVEPDGGKAAGLHQTLDRLGELVRGHHARVEELSRRTAAADQELAELQSVWWLWGSRLADLNEASRVA